MAVRLSSWLGLDRTTWRKLGPGCRVIADAALGSVVATVAAGLIEKTWWSYAAAALASIFYTALPSSFDATAFVIIGSWLAASQTTTVEVWYGLLIGAALGNTSALWVAGLTFLVAMLATPVDTALLITFLISAGVVGAIGYVLLVRPPKKIVARATSKREPHPGYSADFEEDAALLPDLLM